MTIIDNKELGKVNLEKINLMGEYILVEPFAQEKIQGFIIPNNQKDKSCKAKVLKTGNGVLNDKEIKILVQEGDTVFFNEWALKTLEDFKDGIFFIKYSDIISYIKAK